MTAGSVTPSGPATTYASTVLVIIPPLSIALLTRATSAFLTLRATVGPVCYNLSNA